ncbi:MAG: sigma 54-interacting transcriptional regulator, partial [Myxococcota bacterium]
VVEQHVDGARIVDRSRHGTTVNGVRIDESAGLADGDEIGIGEYHVRYVVDDDAESRVPTASALMPLSTHEELMVGSEDGVAYAGVRLRFVRGPRSGESTRIEHGRTTLGGPGSLVVLDDQLPREALVLRVVRGRPMVEAGHAVFLSGVRVRAITPVVTGEELRIGEHGLVVEPEVAELDREREAFGEMVGGSQAMRKLFGALSRIAVHDQPVLLIGESGTGKELAARGLHDEGLRPDGPFVPLNCAAVAESLFESELFGHEKGAFTGASGRRDGAFHRADGGTLFLDEVGELKPDLQAKLLRALESGEVRRVGGHEPTFPDVRVIAATNRDLNTMVAEGTFRADLYWRLAVLTVRLPSLRERKGDVGLLTRTLLSRLHPGTHIEPDAIARLEAHPWPGNVRELRNVLTRAFVMAGNPIRGEAVTFNPWAAGETPVARSAAAASPGDERARLAEALQRSGGNRSQAARALGMPRSTLLYKIEKHGL